MPKSAPHLTATLALFWLTVLAFPLWWLLPDGPFSSQLNLVLPQPDGLDLVIPFGGWQSRLLLSSWTLEQGWWSALITHLFIHGGSPLASPEAMLMGAVHLAANMVTFLSLGSRVERALGPARFLGLYFLSGVAGGLLQLLGTPWLENQPLVGASGAVFGVVIAYCLLFGEQKLLLFFHIVARAATVGRVLLVLTVAFCFAATWARADPAWASRWPGTLQFFVLNIAHLAHLGGALVGLAWGLAARGPRPLRHRSPSVQDSALLQPRGPVLAPAVEELVEAVARSRRLSESQRQQLSALRKRALEAGS